MRIRPPIFKDHGKTYEADACAPLEKAVERGLVQFNALARGHYPGHRLARTVLPGLKTAGYWDAVGRQDWGLGWHRNEGLELTFLQTGALPFAVDDTAWPLKAGDLSITRPWQRHRVGDPCISPGRLYWVILDVGVRRPDQPWRWPSWLVLSPGDLDRLTDLLRHNEQPVWPATADIRHCFEQLGRTLDRGSALGVQSRLAVTLNELFVALAEMLHERSIPLNPALSSARRTVELFLGDLADNPANLAMPWTVAMMAEHCGLGVTAFTRYCKQICNMTPMQCLNKRRIDAAARILETEPSRTVTDIALECGFHTSQYFATVFRRALGCTPNAYRRKHAVS